MWALVQMVGPLSGSRYCNMSDAGLLMSVLFMQKEQRTGGKMLGACGARCTS